jgi:hypothetical protein
MWPGDYFPGSARDISEKRYFFAVLDNQTTQRWSSL